MKQKPTFLMGPKKIVHSLMIPKICYAKTQNTLKDNIERILAPYSKNLDVGIKFESLKYSRVLYKKNSDKKLIPASNIKLITTLAVLKKLGVGYNFKTEFYTDGEIKGGTLEGNIYIKGYGDPSFYTEHMRAIVGALYNMGIRKIEGRIVADDTHFDKDRYAPGILELNPEERVLSYSAPNGALSLNFNTIEVIVKGGKKPWDKPVIILNPSTEYFEIKNLAETRKTRNGAWASKTEKESKEVITVYGRVKPRKSEIFRITIYKPNKYFSNVFKDFLEDQGIKISGDIKYAKVLQDSKLLLTHESKSLSLIVKDLCKESNNFIADQLVKTLDAEVNKKQGTYQKGIQVIRDCLKSIRIEDYELADGSGLSRKNKLTADEIIKVLKEAYKDSEISSEFIKAQKSSGCIKAKTGTLKSVSALSGYVKAKDDIIAFSMLMNSKKIHVKEMRLLQQKIIDELSKDMSLPDSTKITIRFNQIKNFPKKIS